MIIIKVLHLTQVVCLNIVLTEAIKPENQGQGQINPAH